MLYPAVGLCGLAGSGKTTVATALAPLGYRRERFAAPLKDMLRALGMSEAEVDGDLKEAPCDLLRAGAGGRRMGSPEDMLRALGLSDADLSTWLHSPCPALCGAAPAYAIAALLRWGWLLAGLWPERQDDACQIGWFSSGVTPRHAMRTLGTEWGRSSIHPRLWIGAWERRARAVLKTGNRVVCDDVRFPNEAEAVRRLGGTIIRVTSSRVIGTSDHVSERLDFAWDADFANECHIGTICLRIMGRNDGPIFRKSELSNVAALAA